MYTTEITFTCGAVVHQSFASLDSAVESVNFISSRAVSVFGPIESINIISEND